MREIIYRPPFEAESFLLKATQGCSHNRCTFCTMYKGVPFRVLSREEIRAQLRDLGEFGKYIHRVFVESGDAFALSAKRLMEIAEDIREYLPRVETIAMYASINNIQGKTDEELRCLREMGINDLNIGLESGMDEALSYMNKGYTRETAIYELLRLKKAGIDYGLNLILGGAGADKWRENAEATASIINETKPGLIFTGTLHADKGCRMYEDIQEGNLKENTFGEYLDEEELLLSLLELDDCRYFGLHPSNIFPMQGRLCQDREKMLAALQSYRGQIGDLLDLRPLRGQEGAVITDRRRYRN